MTEVRSLLVTGGDGFIGRNLRPVLLERSWKVISLDHRTDAAIDLSCQHCDISDWSQVEAVFRANPIHAVIHLASVLPTAASQDPHRATQVNIVGSLNILEAARKFRVSRMVYASSNSVYGPCPASTLISESQPAAPQDLYGSAKRYVEELGVAYEKNFGLRFLALRIVVVVGAGAVSRTSPWRSEIFEFLERSAPTELFIPFHEDEVLPLVHVEDVATMLALLVSAEGSPENIYNSCAESVSARELKCEVEALNSNLPVRLGTLSFRGGARSIDSTRFQAEFGFRPVPLRDRLRRTAQMGMAKR